MGKNMKLETVTIWNCKIKPDLFPFKKLLSVGDSFSFLQNNGKQGLSCLQTAQLNKGLAVFIHSKSLMVCGRHLHSLSCQVTQFCSQAVEWRESCESSPEDFQQLIILNWESWLRGQPSPSPDQTVAGRLWLMAKSRVQSATFLAVENDSVQDSHSFCMVFKSISFNAGFTVMFLILLTPQRISDHRCPRLSTEQSNPSHQRTVWEHALPENSNVQKGSAAFRSYSAFPCFSLLFCLWHPGRGTGALEKGKAKSVLFISIRYLHTASLVLCVFCVTFSPVPQLNKPHN